MQRGITQIFYWWCYGLFHRSAGKRSARSNTSAVSSAPLSRQHTATFRSENSNNQFNRIPCPIALRQRILGLDQPSCRCSRHYIPQIMDIEYDEFIQMEAPDTQIIVIAVISSLWVCLFVSTRLHLIRSCIDIQTLTLHQSKYLKRHWIHISDFIFSW